jgi:NAD(P)-dependent dehydrogenase (short-subunit alcohol dehydrogenase family)
MMAALDGKHAVVTGASRGIGLAVARSLLAQGARVTLMARDAAALDAAARELGGGVAWQAADVSDAASVEQAFVRAGVVDILVNNAGQAASSPFMRTDAAMWQRMLDVNLSGAYHCIQAALPGMLDAGWGRIVNVASTAGLTGYRYVAAYCAAKHGLVGLTRALAVEFTKEKLRVNAVCPGGMPTAQTTEFSAPDGADWDLILRIASPRGFMETEDVANVIAFLASDDAAAVHGAVYRVDNGKGAG